ncbi:hypothetical protein FOL47_006066 [Perkinsus chesapeaki]|uniref:Bromo domain-containing protein n=1 Tax=Perkinsus chesapeaki TaxID=330153 RepID=A0A7J6LU21_PERCH|nr:hypothetical protein FOL47_006066 [Perkinsus chesapeaki]
MVLTPSLKRQNSEQAGSEAAAGHDRPDESTQAKRRRTGGTHNPQVFGISQRQWRQKPYRDLCGIILRWMRSKDRNQFFYYPVDVNEVPTYRDIIKNPMSFDLMEARASKRAYKTVDDIRKDFNLICTNAMTFNPEGSPWHKAAEKLQADGEKQFDLAQLHGLRLPDDSIESSTVNSRAGSRRSYTRRDHHGTATQVNRNSVEAVDKLPGSLRNALHAIEYTGTPSNMTKDVIEAYATVVEENRFSNRGAPNMLVRVGSSADFIDHTSPGKATVMGSSSSSVLPGELEPKSAEKSLRKFLEGIDGLPEGIVDRHLRRRLGGCPSTVAPLNDCRVFGLDTDDFVAFNGTLRVEREFTGYILGVGYENAMQAAGLSDAGVDTEPLKEMAQRHRASREKQIQNVIGLTVLYFYLSYSSIEGSASSSPKHETVMSVKEEKDRANELETKKEKSSECGHVLSTAEDLRESLREAKPKPIDQKRIDAERRLSERASELFEEFKNSNDHDKEITSLTQIRDLFDQVSGRGVARSEAVSAETVICSELVKSDFLSILSKVKSYQEAPQGSIPQELRQRSTWLMEKTTPKAVSNMPSQVSTFIPSACSTDYDWSTGLRLTSDNNSEWDVEDNDTEFTSAPDGLANRVRKSILAPWWLDDKRGSKRFGVINDVETDSDSDAGASLPPINKRYRSRTELQYHVVPSTSLLQSWRAIKCPFGVIGAGVAGLVAPPKRKTWNRSLAAAVKVIRSAGKNFPRNPTLMQAVCDMSLPGTGKKGVTRWKTTVGRSKIDWYWPVKRTSTLRRQMSFKGPGNLHDNSDWMTALKDPAYPVILFFHGGAYVLCTPGSVAYKPFVTKLAHDCNSFVCALDYSRPPETGLKEIIEEGIISYSYLINSLEIPPERIVLVGDSAGANLALSVMLQLRDRGRYPLPAGLVLLSPWADLSLSEDQLWCENAYYDYLPVELIYKFAQLCARSTGVAMDDPIVSPALAPSLDLKVPVYCTYGEVEILRASEEGLCRRLKMENSKRVEVEMIVDMPHDCYMFCDSKQKTILEACTILVEKIRAMNKAKGAVKSRVVVVTMLTVSSFTSSSTSSNTSSSPSSALDSIVDVTKFLQEELTGQESDGTSEDEEEGSRPANILPPRATSGRPRSQTSLQYHAVGPHSFRQSLRTATLPFALLGATLVGPVAKPKRAVWNRKLATLLRVGRATARDFPRKYELIQKTSDVCIPGVGKKGVCCWMPKRPENIRLQWYWPACRTPTLKASKDFEGFSNIQDSADWYRALQEDHKSPVILYIHGGAFVMCTPQSAAYKPWITELARATDCFLCAVDYDRPPQTGMATITEQGVGAYTYLINDMNIAPERIVICGDSAGGNTALSIAIAVRDQHLPLPGGLALLSPWADLSLSEEQLLSDNAYYDYIPVELVYKFANYCADASNERPSSPVVSPALASSLDLGVPIYCTFGEAELLRYSIQDLCKRFIKENSMPVTVHMIMDMPHDCYTLLETGQHTIKDAIAVLAGRIRDMTSQSSQRRRNPKPRGSITYPVHHVDTSITI